MRNDTQDNQTENRPATPAAGDKTAFDGKNPPISRKQKWLTGTGGLLAGILNGFFGAGGGMIIVPMLRKSGFDDVKSHAMSVSVILPICILSSIFYAANGQVTLQDALPYLPWMLVGSLLGAWLLPKCSARVIRILFGGLMVWAAIRMLTA